MTERPGIEMALSRALVWVLGAGWVALPLLALPVPPIDSLLPVTTAHLAVLVSLGLVVSWDLARSLEEGWFAWLSPVGGRLASAILIVALTVGVVALLTLASSAALRLAPSLQFLQLLSAVDIAWVAGATLIGLRWRLGRRAGVVAGLVVAVVCIWSIWNYLRIVGFAPDGGWQVDAGALFRYVLPYDLAAAVLAVASLVSGARKVTPTSVTSVTTP